VSDLDNLSLRRNFSHDFHDTHAQFTFNNVLRQIANKNPIHLRIDFGTTIQLIGLKTAKVENARIFKNIHETRTLSNGSLISY
jgi:hypothetical protein